MAKSSIHFRPAVATSEAHNLRLTKLDYNVPELEKNNESFSIRSIDDQTKLARTHCKNVSGRKLQKNAMLIREAVVNLLPGTSMDDLKHLGNLLQEQFGINCFQIHIHRDEGHKDPETGQFKINHHAHMLFDWQDKAKGTVLKINRVQLSQIQTLVAQTLGMERGELRVNSNRERLEPIEYKRQQAELQLEKLQQQNAELEQKKNEVRARIERLTGEREIDSNAHRGQKEALRELISNSTTVFTEESEELLRFDENDLNQAIDWLTNEVHRLQLLAEEKK